MWNPQRRNLILASMIAVLLATVANNFLLLRFIAPVYPQVEGNAGIEAQVITAFNFERNTLVFLGAMVFGATNILYLYALYKERHARTGDQFLPAYA
jgi:multisubunit Na+/H+ antiporter MnhB subunit